jgi:pilus assembly protein Flp/PilA
MLKIICNLRKSKKGATAIEYGLIAALIAVAAIAAFAAVGDALTALFSGVASTLSDVAGSNP